MLGTPEKPCKVLLEDLNCISEQSVCVKPGNSVLVSLSLAVDLFGKNYELCHNEYPLLIEGNGSYSISSVPGFCDPRHIQLLITSRKGTPVHITKGQVIGRASSVGGLADHELSREVAVAVTESNSCQDNKLRKIDVEKFVKFEEAMDQQKTTEILSMLQRVGDVFSTGDCDVGRLDVVEHRIELTDESPIYQKPRRFNSRISEQIEAQCRELELLDIIESSDSSWSSPVVPVIKKDGSLRLCIDYRKLNEVTRADRHPLPNLTDAVYSLHGVKYFTSLDLVRGYYQLPLEEKSKEITAFSTPHGHWQFKRLPFGLKNAPAAFQRAMQQVLGAFPRQQVIVYIDDVLIMSETFAEHLQLVERVLQTLSSHGIKIKPDKCSWFQSSVEYLGHIVGSDGIKKSPRFVEKVREMPQPTTVGELREFLGLLNFQRKFVPHFSVIQKPLSEKTSGRRGKKLNWTLEMQKAFDALKEAVCKDVLLSFPDYSKEATPLQLYVDASGTGTGACLSQVQDGEPRIIAYASSCFSKAERSYSTIERELAGMRWAVKTFRPFLIGVEFNLYTDHQPLVYLQNMKIIDSRLARTFEDLADFNFRIIYTPGCENVAADKLSRLYPPQILEDQNHWNDSAMLPAGIQPCITVPGGGNSLFDSLHYLSRVNHLGREACSSVLILRELLVNEILNHPQRYGVHLNKEGRKKLRLMKFEGQLPCIEVLYAFSHLYKCKILVHFGVRTSVWFVSQSLDSNACVSVVHLQCISGVHFNPVQEVPSYNRPVLPTAESGVNLGQCTEDEDVMSEEEVQADVSVLSYMWCMRHAHTHSASIILKVGGVSCCAVFDTGAQISCASVRFFKFHRAMLDTARTHKIRGLGPGETESMGTAEIPVYLQGMEAPCTYEFAVVNDSALPMCVLFGANFMRHFHVILNFASKEYSVGSREPAPFTNFSTGEAIGQAVLSLQAELSPSVKQVCIGAHESSVSFQIACEGNELRLSSVVDIREVITMQKKSSILCTVKDFLQKQETLWPKQIMRFKRYKDKLKIVDDTLIYNGGEHLAYVVTFNLLVEILLVVHHKMAHLGRQKLIELVRQHIWHPSLSRCAGDITSTCDSCQRLKVMPIVAPPVMKIQTFHPFELVAVDLLMLPKAGPYIGCLVAMDHYTKWLTAVPITSKTGSLIAKLLEQRVLPCLLRCPDKILSDNGPEFRSSVFEKVLNKFGIKHLFTTPNRPSSNGLVERANRTLVELLRIQAESGAKWIENLSSVLITHNGTYQSSLGCSPSEMILRSSHEIRDVVRVSSDVKETWREGNPSFGAFAPEQEVLRKRVVSGNEVSQKFMEKFQGPYVVLKANDNGLTYVIKHLKSGKIERAHHGQLRRYMRPPLYIENHVFFRRLQEQEVMDQPEEVYDRVADFATVCDLASSSSDSFSSEDDRGENEDRSSSSSSFSDSSESSSLSTKFTDLSVDDAESKFDKSTDAPVVLDEVVAEEMKQQNKNMNEDNGMIVNNDTHVPFVSTAFSEFPMNPNYYKLNLDWDLSEVEETDADKVQEVKEKCFKILDAGIRGLQSSVNILKLTLSSDSSDERLSKLSTEDSPVFGMLKQLETLVERINNSVKLSQSLTGADESRADRAEFQDSLSRREMENENENETLHEMSSSSKVSKIIQTRSKGPVEDLPRIMLKPLEYRRKSRSSVL
mgnify:CR=1 FL=1